MMMHHTISTLESVASICLGTGNFGSRIDEDTSRELLDRFVEAGGNFLDTAHVYGAWDTSGINGGCGNSEVAIGRWMKSRGCRGQMIIGTKGGHPDFETRASCMTAADVRRHLQESLDHLQTDTIDVYWLHRDDRNIPVADILGWFVEPVEQGLIRMLACSNWRADRIADARHVAAAQGLPTVEASQIAWSLAHPQRAVTDGPYGEQIEMDDATWAFHCDTQVPVVPYSSQAGGLFAKLDDNGVPPATPEDFPKPGLIRRYGNNLTYERWQRARRLAERKDCSTNHIALAWLLHQPFPTFPIIGPRTLGQLADSLRAADVTLTDDAAWLGQVESARWPDGFFPNIRVDDDEFRRPEQGETPPIRSLEDDAS